MEDNSTFSFLEIQSGIIFELPIEEAKQRPVIDLNFLMKHQKSKCWASDYVETATNTILEDMALLEIGTPKLRESLAKKYFKYTCANVLSAYCYPHVDMDDMKVATCLMLFLWILDDICLGKTKEEISEADAIYANVNRALAGEQVVDEHPGVKMATYMRSLVMKNEFATSSSFWLNKFNGNLAEYFSLCVELAKRRLDKRRIVNLQEYLLLRHPDSAIKPCFDLYELFNKASLSQYASNLKEFNQMMYLSSFMVSLVNDAFSHYTEIVEDEGFNVLLTLQDQFDLEFHQAVFVLDSMISFMMKEFDRLDDLLENDPLLNETDKVYIFGLRSWVVSSFDWSIQCRRYHNKNSFLPELVDSEESLRQHLVQRTQLPFLKHFKLEIS